MDATARFDTRLPQRVEVQTALDPGEAVPKRCRNVLQLVRVTPVHTRLQPAVARPNLLRVEFHLAEPELSLRRTAGEDDVGETLDFPAKGLVRRTPHTRCSVVGAACHCDAHVRLRPRACVELLPQLSEADFELARAIFERWTVIDDLGVLPLTEADQIGAGAGIPFLVRIEMETRQEPLKEFNMVRILGTDKQMQIDEPAFGRRRIQPQFHVRKNEAHPWQSSVLLVFQEPLVRVRDVVISDRNRFDGGRRPLECTEIVVPGRRTLELVVHQRARRVNMRLPAVPLRSSADHLVSYSIVTGGAAARRVQAVVPHPQCDVADPWNG